MQDEQQFEQLMLQYNQLKNGSEDIKRMIESEDFDSAITMLKNREQIFMNCKCMRKFLELTPVQTKELDKVLDELRALEIENIKNLTKSMEEVKKQLKINQKNEKIHNAYDYDENQKGSILNVEE